MRNNYVVCAVLIVAIIVTGCSPVTYYESATNPTSINNPPQAESDAKQTSIANNTVVLTTQPESPQYSADKLGCMPRADKSSHFIYNLSRLSSKKIDDGSYRPEEWVAYWQECAIKGYSWAQIQLGGAYSSGIGVEKNNDKAIFWYRIAAGKGDTSAQVALGELYYNGDGVRKDRSNALKWWQKAAELGDKNAQKKISFAYLVDDEKTYAVEAVKWWHKDAENGDTYVFCSLGGSYSRGEGVTRNYAEAVKWWRRSVEQGHDCGLIQLGRAYALGQGVSQDYVIAYMWFAIAGKKGKMAAHRAIDILEKQLSRTQITQAQKLAAEWKPTSKAK